MAFKKRSLKQSVTGSPDQLFRELPRRKFPDVLPHQQSMMQRYAGEAEHKPDVALQLPTGSGKTLVGLLIAEWRRRKHGEKVVFLCPTKQLVNQAVEQAETRYGLSVLGFTGSKANYDPTDVAKYKQGLAIAVTTYSSVFNVNPFFADPDIIIVDDAHSAENYVSKLWSLEVNRLESDHKTTHEALCDFLKPYLDTTSLSRLSGDWEGPNDSSWVDKLPTPILDSIKSNLIELLDEFTRDNNLHFSWSMIRSHLSACHLYYSSKGFLIRPLLPPTWAHEAFSNATQRIFMSATLGEGGDLERLTGRKSIFRLPTPAGWDTQGVGRRFFLFPSQSLNEPDRNQLIKELLQSTERSLILVPNDTQATAIKNKITENTKLKVYSATDIEHSKSDFLNENSAVAVIANRYDGIDFPGDECRLLIIEGLPKTVNLQEQFLMSRIGAIALFNERVQTRVIQAIGRCTRSLEDFSTVIVNGTELVDYLADKKRRNFFHPELQAELEFGVDQSIQAEGVGDFVENFNIFIENGEEWEEVNNEIVDIRASKEKLQFPGIAELEASVNLEIEYVQFLWSLDFISALGKAEEILGKLNAPELKGYRAMWEYLAGSSAYQATGEGLEDYSIKAKEHFLKAKNAAKDIPWLSKLHRFMAADAQQTQEEASNTLLMKQVEGIENVLASVGSTNSRKLLKIEKDIREGLVDENKFEEAHRKVGELLGFDARKIENDGSPDPWWQLENVCIVFEDHANSKNDMLDAKKARQACLHPNWLRENITSCQSEEVEILSVLISPVTKVKRGGAPHIHEVMYWNLDSFRAWVERAIGIIKELRVTFQQSGDLVWRSETASRLKVEGLDMMSIVEMLKSTPCRTVLEVVD